MASLRSSRAALACFFDKALGGEDVEEVAGGGEPGRGVGDVIVKVGSAGLDVVRSGSERDAGDVVVVL